MKDKQELTIKQKRWLECYGDCDSKTFGNATQSAIMAYGLDRETQYDSARVIGWENLTKLNIEIGELMDEVGLSDVKLISKLARALEAKKPYGKSATMHADNMAQLKALEIAFKLKNTFKEVTKETGGIFSQDKIDISIVDCECKKRSYDSIS